MTGKGRPIAIKKGTDSEIDEELTANPYPTWKKLEEMVDKGKVRNIGVSKYVFLKTVIFPYLYLLASTSRGCATLLRTRSSTSRLSTKSSSATGTRNQSCSRCAMSVPPRHCYSGLIMCVVGQRERLASRGLLPSRQRHTRQRHSRSSCPATIQQVTRSLVDSVVQRFSDKD